MRNSRGRSVIVGSWCDRGLLTPTFQTFEADFPHLKAAVLPAGEVALLGTSEDKETCRMIRVRCKDRLRTKHESFIAICRSLPSYDVCVMGRNYVVCKRSLHFGPIK